MIQENKIEPTIQNIFILYGLDYIKKHNLSEEQWKVYNSIINCKTSNLGYHIITCDHCGTTTISFNSCRNRHCPMCQSYAKEKWISNEESYILECNYFHVVTTHPNDLNIIALYNPKIFYNILFKATSESILQLAEDSKWLGAKVGITSVLHTWGQTMELHPHIHSIVTGGGLKNNKWIDSKEQYLFKVKVLSSLFRAKVLSMLKNSFNNLIFPSSLNIKSLKDFESFLRPLYKKEWISYIEPPKGNVSNAIEYLGRYSHKIAISNERIKNIDNGQITFEYKDYKDNGKIKLMTLSAEEFLRRFFMHILPSRFTKIKHYGLLSNRNKKKLINRCRFFISQLKNRKFIRRINKKKKSRLPQFKCSKCGGSSFSYEFFYGRSILQHLV